MRTLTALLSSLLLLSCGGDDSPPSCPQTSAGSDRVVIWSEAAQACISMPVCTAASCQ